MGYYVNCVKTESGYKELPALGKARELLNHGGIQVSGNEFVPNLICVVHNGAFEAAGYCYCEEEYEHFRDNTGGRQIVWITHPDAAFLSNYHKR